MEKFYPPPPQRKYTSYISHCSQVIQSWASAWYILNLKCTNITYKYDYKFKKFIENLWNIISSKNGTQKLKEEYGKWGLQMNVEKPQYLGIGEDTTDIVLESGEIVAKCEN